MAITVAAVRKDTLEYLGNTPVRSTSVTQGVFWGYDCWAVQFQEGQPMLVGWIFTPTDPAQPWLGGTFTAPAPSYPPIETQREQASIATKAVADAKQATLAGSSQEAAGLEKERLELVAVFNRTPEQQARLDQLNSAWAVCVAITERFDELVAWINAEADQAILAAYDPTNPPDGLGWPA